MAEGACGWGPESPKVSVIIAAYCPGEAVHRVIDSLDAQTLPQRDFEVIFVDDGSPDDTFARLQGFAATRPNMRVLRIKNSGWPSRPRNTGIEHARGEYLLFSWITTIRCSRTACVGPTSSPSGRSRRPPQPQGKSKTNDVMVGSCRA